ncbi:MAG: hypothetical protein PVF22_03530 [Candidatus Aminicenantes bacterium]|jgi:hypothetical protein
MKKSMILFLALIFLTPSLAFSGIVTFKLGFFIPRAQSDLWEIEFENMSYSKSDYYGSNFGFVYEYFLTRQLSLTLGVDGYNRNKSGFYVDWVGILGSAVGEPLLDFAFPLEYQDDFLPTERFDIFHSFLVSITPIQASLKVAPLGRGKSIIPYIGGGVGLYIWSVRLQGFIVDFADDTWEYDPGTGPLVPVYPVYESFAREDSRLSIGYHGFAGIMIPVAQKFTLEAEIKYNSVKGNFRTGADASFVGFDAFDMSGYQLSLGMNYWF